MGEQRTLTAGEIALARAAFGDEIEYDGVTLSDGPGSQPLAHLAFAKGNPAITVGSTVYFKADYCPDFSAPGRNRRSFIHEMTHVWQYGELGLAAFFLRYGGDLLRAGGNPDAMYVYTHGETGFDDAMIEQQAEMVGDYSNALWSQNAQGIALFTRNMAGSGLYGL
ncbi:MAG: hypothetical protein QOD42_1813 [Sphingomonadales bacterium]|jgi:hypothetical protein|nr:hypothetical protein [Sphingomonadales bacterium]